MNASSARLRPRARNATRGLRVLLTAVAGCAAIVTGRARDAGEPIDFDAVRHRARLLAAQPFAPPAHPLPEWLKHLNYDEHRLIEFDVQRSLWREEGLPFQAQFFHPGYLHDGDVALNEVHDRRATPILFRRDYFNYHQLKLGALPSWLGFAGFRLLYPLNHADDELGAFLGASYFRFLCTKAVYGLSARGLAVDTAEPGGEEFPRFVEFWLVRPKPAARSVTVFALLDGPSVAGAYRFEITPGAETLMNVKVVLYTRRNPAVLGLAPLTSMYWYGENSRAPGADFRPEVHDSDGLMMNTGAGEWLWRPLANPAAMRTAAFADENPRGFGLLQRDRNFEDYQDLEAKYQLRPSAWVEPVGRWGRGAVRLVELPTGNEFGDNIVAFWMPEKLPAPGEPLEFEYRLHWFMDQIRPPAGFAVATRHGRGFGAEADRERFVVDFDGPYLHGQGPDPAIEPMVSVGPNGRLGAVAVQKNPYNGTWRTVFTVQPDGSGRPIELRCFLRKSPHVLTETWSYLWQP